MTQKPKPIKAKDKILAAASDLFYRQGYQATVVNQIINASGVSKPTFYTHYKSKEELCLIYLKEQHAIQLNVTNDIIRSQKTPYDRFMASIKFLEDRVVSLNYRGCAFFNVISEIGDPENAIFKEAINFNNNIKTILKNVTLDLIQSEPKYKDLDADYISDTYYIILSGAIVAAQEYRDTWPFKRSVKAIETLIDVR